jgi:hypothetical protein
MKPILYMGNGNAPEGCGYVGFFVDEGKLLPMYFTGDSAGLLLNEMVEWLEKERAKVGLTAELVEKRKAALAAARAARKAKKEAAA